MIINFFHHSQSTMGMLADGEFYSEGEFCLLTDVSYIGRLAGEDSDLDSSRDTSSDGSIEYEVGKNSQISREQWVHDLLTCENTLKMRNMSVRDEHCMIQEGFSSDDGDAGNPRSVLLFQFFEQDLPYQRVPLADKASWFFSS